MNLKAWTYYSITVTAFMVNIGVASIFSDKFDNKA